jgi:LRR receptor-like serine/threonine-protein kinase FLS2
MATSRDFILMSTTVMLIFVCANTHLIHDYQKSRERVQVDIEALQAFKSSVTYDPSQALANWDVANHVCNWTGVTCHPQKLRVSG